MREILFRGQTRKYGERCRVTDGKPLPGKWVYGGVLQGNGDRSIIYAVDEEGHFDAKYPVHSDTVGQYICWKDADGTKVFEDDIVQYYGEGWDEEDGPGVVEWDNETARFVITLDGLTVDFDNCYPWEVKVIGNIHDNPELMEVK